MLIISFRVNALCACSLKSQAQASDATLQKERTDSLQRAMMKNLLGVSDQTITAIFALRDNSVVKSDRIIRDTSLTPGQISIALQNSQ